MSEATTPTLVTHTFDNGLSVFLRASREAPVTSFWTWYRVGSRNERPGLTGLSHWVEHMQFNGTSSLEKGAIFRKVSRRGGTLNAMTSSDWTAYFETLPADQIELSLRIESDRMSNSLFDPAETERERTVILSERQGAENRPTYHLSEEVIGAAFHAHPYRHMVIGYEQDLRTITRDDLYDHYKLYYAPNRAFITAAGDFDPDDMLTRIESAFGAIPRNDAPLPVVSPDAPQRGERRITVRKPSPAAYLMMAYRMPGARHPDVSALLVADALLSGAKPMGMGGGSAMGRSSRLYRALVTTGLARSASSGTSLHLDPHLWTLSATALPGIEERQIEDAIKEEIERLRTDLADEDEFIKARKQIRAQYVYSRETVTSQAYWLGQMEIIDHAARVDILADELAAVTPDDVRRVARIWLVPDQRVVGWQVPEDSAVHAGAEFESSQEPASLVDPQVVWGLSGGEGSRHGFVRTELSNGIVVLAQPRPGIESVEGAIRIPAGQSATGERQAGLASITGTMLNRGTTTRTFEQFNEAIDGLGAIMGVSTDRDDTEVGFHSLVEDLETVLSLAAEIIRQPVFPQQELERVRQQVLTGLREQDNDTGSAASRAVRELMYPEDHPYRLRVSGEAETVSAFTADDLRDYHRHAFDPRGTAIAVAGGIDSLEALVEQLERVFGDWTANTSPARPVPSINPPDRTRRRFIEVPGKSQADISIAQPTLPRSLEPEYFALQLANAILGQLGMMGRLGANVRERLGLAYYSYSSFSGGEVNSVWTARAGVDPGNVERAIGAIVDELRAIRETPVSADELEDAKGAAIGGLPLAVESLGGVVDLLLNIERYGLGLDYLDRYPGYISNLDAGLLLDAMRRHLDPDRLVIGVAGPAGAGRSDA